MVRSITPSRRVARSLPLAAVALLVAMPAQAQFGSIRRAVEQRAGQQAERRVEDKANVGLLQPPTFDATTVEITDALLDKYLAAYDRIRTTRASRQAEDERLVALISAQRDSVAALGRANQADERRFMDAEEKFRECSNAYEQKRDSLVDAAMEKMGERLQQRLQANPMAAGNDPAVKRMMDYMDKYARAQATGDTLLLKKIQLELLATSMTPAERAAASRTLAQSCGPTPAKPAWMVQQAAIEARAQANTEKRWAAAKAAGQPTGADLGLTDVQAAMLDERIKSWQGGMRANAPLTVRFTRAEYDRLVARRGAIEKAQRG